MRTKTYILLNAFAIAIALVLSITDVWFIGVFVLAGIAIEFFSGRYKNYVNDDQDARETQEERSAIKRVLLPFVIAGVILLIFVVFAIVRNYA